MSLTRIAKRNGQDCARQSDRDTRKGVCLQPSERVAGAYLQFVPSAMIVGTRFFGEAISGYLVRRTRIRQYRVVMSKVRGNWVVMRETYPTVVGASFSQFYLRSTGAPKIEPVFGETSLTMVRNPGEIMFSSPVQDADFKVDVHVNTERPDPLDDGWNDVVEVSFHAGTDTFLTGWEPTPGDLRIPLTDGKPYRLRYAVADIDLAAATNWGPVEPPIHPLIGIIAIDIWPQEPTPAQVVVQKTAGGRYFLVAHGLDRLRNELFARQSTTTELQRVTEFADRAFVAYPELVDQAIADSAGGLSSTAAMLGDMNYSAAPRSLEERPTGANEIKARVADVILQRAREIRGMD